MQYACNKVTSLTNKMSNYHKKRRLFYTTINELLPFDDLEGSVFVLKTIYIAARLYNMVYAVFFFFFLLYSLFNVNGHFSNSYT